MHADKNNQGTKNLYALGSTSLQHFHQSQPPTDIKPVFTPPSSSLPNQTSLSEAPLNLSKSEKDPEPPVLDTRRRSRKGKASKIDALCLKLQEKAGGADRDSGDDAMFSQNVDSFSEQVEESENTLPLAMVDASNTNDGHEKDELSDLSKQIQESNNNELHDR